MNYISAIKTALVYFPFIAFLFTIPFILYQYHKYGSINKKRILIEYSFVLYLICIYFLVILPLPNKETLVKPRIEMINLIPFSFIFDFIKETSFNISDSKTYLTFFTDSCVYVVIFNILMTIPFGMYLRYYFKCNKYKTTYITFLLSLFFELTQLSGLYFIYPYPYRLFDVDDLILNTFGGYLGYYLVGIVASHLPSRDKIDDESYQAGINVSGFRRITIFNLDLFIYVLITAIFWILTNNKHSVLIIFVIYYMFIPLFIKQTIGSRFLKTKFEYDKLYFLKTCLRIILIYWYYILLPLTLINISIILVRKLNIQTHESIMFYFIVLSFITLFLIVNLIHLIRYNRIFYDRLFKTKYISTIKLENEKINL